MDYQKHYEQLIAKHGSQGKPEGYSERHHILPKSMGGSDDANNLVYLSAKAHFVAHHLLWRWHRNAPMAYAFNCMSVLGSDHRHRPSSVVYAEAKAAMAAAKSREMFGEGNNNYGKKHSAEARAKIARAAAGRRASAETKAKMSKVRLGRSISAEHCANISKSKSGAKHPRARLANIHCNKSGDLLATGVVLSVWARENGYSKSALSLTARSDLTKPHVHKSNPHQHKGIYARYI